ncbi:hypothetical protein ASZ78_011264 [Callipepla squamata]|uniref:Inositol 1,4,5-trisphosphate receptor-interacting protein-like 1 n=1 Tax=Callipepla squamata TaxID=9009 RepID=A0A226MV24_CALSU|nr:hypothetical protein ASZ78_011264 [Callipepla squamata]
MPGTTAFIANACSSVSMFWNLATKWLTPYLSPAAELSMLDMEKMLLDQRLEVLSKGKPHLKLPYPVQIMALIFVTALWLQRLPNVGNELDVATLDHMQQNEVYLQEQMTKLQQEIEQNRMDQCRVDLQHFPSFTQWSWMIWTFTALLLFLLFGFFLCCFRRRQRKTKLQRICEAWGIHDQEEEELVDDEDPSDGTDRSRLYPKYSTWPLKYMQDKCSVVEELMDKLLAACDVAAPSYFMPRLQAPVGVGIGFEGDSREGSHAIFRMLVPLQLPLGHDFHLELGPEGEVGLRNSRLHVEPKCMCARELLLGDVLCFLHHPEDELRKKQMPSLLKPSAPTPTCICIKRQPGSRNW